MSSVRTHGRRNTPRLVFGFTIVHATGEPSRFFRSRSAAERAAGRSGGQAIYAIKFPYVAEARGMFFWCESDHLEAVRRVASGELAGTAMPPPAVWSHHHAEARARS